MSWPCMQLHVTLNSFCLGPPPDDIQVWGINNINNSRANTSFETPPRDDTVKPKRKKRMADSLFPLKSKGLVLFGHAYIPPHDASL